MRPDIKEDLNLLFTAKGSPLPGEEPCEGLGDLLDQISSLNPTVIYVRSNGVDKIGAGSSTTPFKTIKAAQASIKDASVPGPFGGFIQNQDKVYVIDIGPGTFSEDPDWAFNPYISYRGAGADITFIVHSDFSNIVVNYGDNYGSFVDYFNMHVFHLHFIRTPGFDDMSQTGNYNGGFNFATFSFFNCTTNRMVVQGSGFDQGFDWATGGPNIVVDQFIFNSGFVGGLFQACQFQSFSAQGGDVEINHNGADQAYSLSNPLTSSAQGCSFGSITVDDYASIYVTNSAIGSAAINGRVNDPVFTGLYGQFPFINMDPSSLPFAPHDGGIQFNGGALSDQLQYSNQVNLPATFDDVFGGTPYTNIGGFNTLVSHGGAAVDITLQGGGFDHAFAQKIVDAAGDASSNNITIHAPSRWKLNGGVTSLTKSTDFGQWTCIPTSVGHVNGSSQISDVVLTADSAGSLNNTWFVVYALTYPPVFAEIPFVIWFNVDGTGTAPTGVPAGSHLIEVKIHANDSSDVITYKMMRACYGVFDNHTGRGINSFLDVETVGGANKISRVQARADLNGDLNGTWFKFFSTYDQEQYVVYFHVNGMAVLQPTVAGTTEYFRVDIDANSDATTVNFAWAIVVDASIPFLQYNPLPPYTIPDNAFQLFFGIPALDTADIISPWNGTATTATDGTVPTGFTFSEEQAGVATHEVTFTDFTAGVTTDAADGSAPTGFTITTPTPGVDDVRGTFAVSP